MSLTPIKKKILDFCDNYTKRHGYSPSISEIAKHLKKVNSTIHQHMEELKSLGYLKREKHKQRSVEISRSEELVSIPLLGSIAAGEPLQIFEEESEKIAVPKNKIPHSSKVFALRVSGNSMIEENINDGDVVLIKQQTSAENGQRVVALIDNSEATLKRIYREKNHTRLQPANKSYEPIIVEKQRDIKVQGIVIDVIQTSKNTHKLQVEAIPTNKRAKSLTLNKIILGDVLMELKKIPDESCDIIISDPPYNIGKDFGNNIDKRELSDYISWCKEWINDSIRVLKPTGTMFVYGFSEILAYLSVEIPINKRWLIWHYTNKNVASLNFWQRSHEAIVCAWKNKPLFNRDEIREPYTEGFLNGAAGKTRKGTIGRFSKGGTETVYKAHEGGALPRDVIKIPALAGGAGMIERWFICKTCNDIFEPQQLKNHSGHEIVKHPTQKPLELSRKLIRSAMPNKNGVVLVPFVGTGSECVAAKELGQNYIGFEINPDYVWLAEKTINSVKFNSKLF